MQPMYSRSTTIILCFFLGGIGAHRFYLGQTGLGFVYLIFCLTLVPAFVALIDLIVFLFMSNAAFDRKYNSIAGVNKIGNNMESDLDQIAKLADLHDRGVITDEEFEIKKRQLL